jgi:glycosyltransferase involved in cell wall biosynthesis
VSEKHKINEFGGISVIIPVYNRQEFIGQAIESVLDQDFEGEVQVIVVDDGSTDNTLEIVKSYGERILLIEKQKGQVSCGASSARNRGLVEANQPYVCFLDSDDFYLPGHLKQIFSGLSKDQNIGFAFCKTLMYKEDAGTKLYKSWTYSPVLKKDTRHPVVSRAFIVSTNVFLFRRQIFKKIGYFNEEYTNAEDIDMWMRISEQYRGTFLNYYGAVYRVGHGYGQLTRTARDNINVNSLKVYKDAIKRYYEIGLKCQFRIFSLKRSFYYYKYANRLAIYRIISLWLVLRYPLGFIQRIPLFYYGKIFKKQNKTWHDLDFFLNE